MKSLMAALFCSFLPHPASLLHAEQDATTFFPVRLSAAAASDRKAAFKHFRLVRIP